MPLPSKKEKKVCEACNGKGYYSQMFGMSGSADFIGDKGFEIPPKIHLIACPKCNFRNKKKLKDVIQSKFYAK